MPGPIPSFLPKEIKDCFVELDQLPREEAHNKAIGTAEATIAAMGVMELARGNLKASIAYVSLVELITRYRPKPVTVPA